MALEGGEGSASHPGRSLPPVKTRYPLYRRLGGPQERSGQVRKISSPTGIRSPDRPARNQSLYRLSYRAHTLACSSAKTERKFNCVFNLIHAFFVVVSYLLHKSPNLALHCATYLDSVTPPSYLQHCTACLLRYTS